MKNRLTLNYILFLILSFVVIFGYSYFFSKPVKKSGNNGKAPQQAEQNLEKTEKNPVTSAEPGSRTTPSTSVNNQRSVPPIDIHLIKPSGRTLTVETPLFTAKIDTLGGRIIEWDLKKYRETTDKDSPPVKLVNGPENSIYSIPDISGIRLPDLIPFKYNGSGTINVIDKDKQFDLTWNGPSGINITKTITVEPDTYLLKSSIKIRNNSSETLDSRLFLYTYGFIEHKGRGENSHSFELMFNNEVKRIESKPEEEKKYSGQINWFAFSEQYFIKSVIPESGAVTTLNLRSANDEKQLVSEYVYPTEKIPSGAAYSKNWEFYLGPKDGQTLSAAGYNMEKAVNYGWVEFMAKIALKFLKMLNSVFHNYGISIIAITLIFRIAFLPLTLRSMRSMKIMQSKMQKIKPKIDALKEKYKEDKTKQNQELMKLYSSHGVNPLSSLGGCLPLLIQLPVFIALYDVLLYSIELRHSSFLWMMDLSRPEQLFDIPLVGIPFRILPLLMGVSWYFSQKLTPTTTPASEGMELQMKMMQFMPIIFTVMFWGLPSGLILYWTVSNILSVGQQLYIKHKVHV